MDIVREYNVCKKTFLTKNSFKKYRKRGKCEVNKYFKYRNISSF